MANQDISRKQAAQFIEEVLKFTHQLEQGQVVKNDPKQMQMGIGNRLRTIASQFDLEVPHEATVRPTATRTSTTAASA